MTTVQPLTCFKAYDVRGRIGHDLDAGIAGRIAGGFAQVLAPRKVVVGRDGRATSPELADAVIAALVSAGVEVADIGVAGTEEVYFATAHLETGGGIEITASHNPIDYNGFKLVGPGSRPLSDEEFAQVKAAAEAGEAPKAPGGSRDAVDTRAAYATHVARFAGDLPLRPTKILANAGNGVAGAAFDAIAERLVAAGAPLEIVRLHHYPDATFPNGIPNPLLPENRPTTAEAVRTAGADVGLAWDGDFDRCFFFDETGDFVDGEHVVAILAAAALADESGGTVVHDPRVVWNTRETVAAAGGRTRLSKVGHAFMKRAMREEDAVYGGEMSAHHYFRDFFYCDSGMIPWVLLLRHMSRTGESLSSLVKGMRAAFPTSGEINYRVAAVAPVIEAVRQRYVDEALQENRLDGLSLEFADWRLNLRASSTEPLLRLNLETSGDRALLERRRTEIEALIAVSG